MAEYPAVNRTVVGSSPPPGASSQALAQGRQWRKARRTTPSEPSMRGAIIAHLDDVTLDARVKEAVEQLREVRQS